MTQSNLNNVAPLFIAIQRVTPFVLLFFSMAALSRLRTVALLLQMIGSAVLAAMALAEWMPGISRGFLPTQWIIIVIGFALFSGGYAWEKYSQWNLRSQSRSTTR